MNTTHSVSAEERITFTQTKPVVTARHGHLYGSRLRLAALTIKVTALTQDDGSARISTALTPEIEAYVYNPDQLPASDWRYLTLDEDQIPAQCIPEHVALVATVHALHPALRFADALLAAVS